jgi:hypothetical protein
MAPVATRMIRRLKSYPDLQIDAEYGSGLSVQSHKLGIAGSNPASATNMVRWQSGPMQRIANP